MFRVVASLVGLAVMGALFAGIYYAPDNQELRDIGPPAFAPSPGEVRSFGIEPSLEGYPILVQVTVISGEVDVYVLDREWGNELLATDQARIDLERPFNFHAQWSRSHVNGTFETTIVSDGETFYTLLIDNSDNHYEGDAVPDPENGTAEVRITTRYVDTEKRTLVYAYLAATPSILLVAFALGRQGVRLRRRSEERPPGEER